MKNKKLGYIALAVGIIVFNIISFVVPMERTTAFWVVYAFSNVAFLSQVFIWKYAFKSPEMKSNFLGIPIIYIAILYLICQLICFAAAVVSHVATWVAIISSITILGISCLLMTTGAISRNTVQSLENKVNDDTAFMREIRLKIDCMIAEEKDPEIRTKLQDVADVAKYSNAMSSKCVIEIEREIVAILDKKQSLNELDKVITLLNKRNSIIKSNKGKGEQKDGN